MDDANGIAQWVRETDPERFLGAIFAREPVRSHLLALAAFNHEVAKIAGVTREAAAGAIRLQWWRDVVEEIYEGTVRAHPVVQALAETVDLHDLPRAPLDALIDAREFDVSLEAMPDWAAFDVYADATAGALLWLGAQICDVEVAEDDPFIVAAGRAQALCGHLRVIRAGAPARKSFLPDAGEAPADRAAKAIQAARAAWDGRLRGAMPVFVPLTLTWKAWESGERSGAMRAFSAAMAMLRGRP